jgi:ATP-dependent Clp protease, protease subunit
MSRNIPEHVSMFHSTGLYLPTRTMMIEGEDINYEDIYAAVKNLHILDNLTSQSEITIIMNSDGGDNTLGFMLYDAIKACKNHVKIIVYGNASSMGSIILQAADERILMPNTHIMIHLGEVGIPAQHPKSVEAWLEHYKKMDRTNLKILFDRIKEKKPRFTLDKLKEICDHDTIYTAQEAVDMGLADKIMEIPE